MNTTTTYAMSAATTPNDREIEIQCFLCYRYGHSDGCTECNGTGWSVGAKPDLEEETA
jgi:hypothetical protein